MADRSSVPTNVKDRRAVLPTGFARRPEWRFHVLVEIANFAALRRHIGCPRADTLIEDVARRLAAIAPQTRIAAVGRNLIELAFEGDTHADIDVMLDMLAAAGEQPFNLDGEQHEVLLLFGAASAKLAQANDVTIVEEAEAALAEARAADRTVTHDLMPSSGREVRLLATELKLAIDRDELLMLYQPKIHVRRQQVTSAEALVRWRHPDRGMVLPNDFIPAAEQAQIIDRMTLWTIAQVIRDQQTLRAAGHDLRIFINISGQLLADPVFVRAACDLITDSNATLGFEVTETSVIRDPGSAIANLQRFADIGVTIAIDDYGAGLSSLAYLKQLPARELKIDKLFVTQLTSSNRDPLIVRSTIDLAHALEMEVVAEGVETHAALALLTVMGCDMVQGFLISRPIALEALISFLRDGSHRQAPQDSRETFSRLASAWKRA